MFKIFNPKQSAKQCTLAQYIAKLFCFISVVQIIFIGTELLFWGNTFVHIGDYLLIFICTILLLSFIDERNKLQINMINHFINSLDDIHAKLDNSQKELAKCERDN